MGNNWVELGKIFACVVTAANIIISQWFLINNFSHNKSISALFDGEKMESLRRNGISQFQMVSLTKYTSFWPPRSWNVNNWKYNYYYFLIHFVLLLLYFEFDLRKYSIRQTSVRINRMKIECKMHTHAPCLRHHRSESTFEIILNWLHVRFGCEHIVMLCICTHTKRLAHEVSKWKIEYTYTVYPTFSILLHTPPYGIFRIFLKPFLI